MAKYLCECGQTVELKSYDVSSGRRKSCGCREHKVSHFMGMVKTKHPLYQAFKQMKYREGGRCPTFSLEDLFELAQASNYELGMLCYRIDSTKPYSKDNIVFRHDRPAVTPNIEKAQATQIEKYGKLYVQTGEYLEKKKKTSLQKYGYEHPSQSPEVIKKSAETRQKNIEADPNYR